MVLRPKDKEINSKMIHTESSSDLKDEIAKVLALNPDFSNMIYEKAFKTKQKELQALFLKKPTAKQELMKILSKTYILLRQLAN